MGVIGLGVPGGCERLCGVKGGGQKVISDGYEENIPLPEGFGALTKLCRELAQPQSSGSFWAALPGMLRVGIVGVSVQGQQLDPRSLCVLPTIPVDPFHDPCGSFPPSLWVLPTIPVDPFHHPCGSFP